MPHNLPRSTRPLGFRFRLSSTRMAWRLSILHFTTLLLTTWPYWLQGFAQKISTDTPVPPLQWINLSDLLKGSSPPPPLKDAAVGYDETRHALNVKLLGVKLT